MNKSSFAFLFACSVLALLVGCSGGGINSGTASSLDGSENRLQRAIVDEQLARRTEELGGVPAESRRNYNYLMGELALKNNKYDEALEFFESAVDEEDSAAPTLRRRLAQLYLREGRLDEALSQLDLAFEGVPDSTELLQLRAGILATLKRTDEAIATYRTVINKREPGSSEEPYVYLASLYAQQNNIEQAKTVLRELLAANTDSFFANYYLAKISAASGSYEEAERYYKSTLKLNPNAEGVHLELAQVYVYQKRIDDAIAVCRKVVEKNPSNVRAHGMLAELLLGKDKVDDALKEFEAVQALEADPSDTRFKIALIKLQRRDLEGAEVELRLVLAEHPENSAARYYLGTTYAGLKRVNDAVTQLTQVEEGQDYFVESRTLAAYLLRQEQRYAEAVGVLEELTDDNPQDTKLLVFLAGLQREAGEVDEAIETMERVLVREPEDDTHYFTLGVYLDEADKREEALEAMGKSIELNPKNANALNYLGYSLAELNRDLDEAESYIRRALALEKDNGYFIDSLGWVDHQRGELDKALRELERAVALVPNDAVILEHLGIIQSRMGKVDEARETLEKALKYARESDDKDVGRRVRGLLEELQTNVP